MRLLEWCVWAMNDACPWINGSSMPLCLCLCVCGLLNTCVNGWPQMCGHVWDFRCTSSCVRLWVQGWAVTQPASWQMWQCLHPWGWSAGGAVGVVGTETNLGHDRSTGGRGNAWLRRLHRLGWSLAEALGGHNYRGLLWSHHSHGWCQGALLEEQRRDEEINRMWRLAYSKATENRREAPQCSCHIWCPDLSGHCLTDKEEGGDKVITERLGRIEKSSMLLFRVSCFKRLVPAHVKQQSLTAARR